MSKVAIEILQFCTTYLCEQSFSSLLLIKNYGMDAEKKLENVELLYQC